MEFTGLMIRMVCWIRMAMAARMRLEVRPLGACPSAFLPASVAWATFHPLVAFRLAAFLPLNRKRRQ